MNDDIKSVCFAWRGMPSYAVCGIRQFILDNPSVKVSVISEAVSFFEENVESIAGVGVCKIEIIDNRSINEILGYVPDVIFTSGWSQKTFNRFVDDVNKNGGRSFAMVDTISERGVKNFLRRLKIKFYYSRKFAGFFVPGKLGVKLFRSSWIPCNKVKVGMLTADSGIFNSDATLSKRKREILYVGKFNERKNIVRTVKIFKELHDSHSDWYLTCMGAGDKESELRAIAKSCAGITIKPFATADELSKAYKESKFFILGSYNEPWGVVVHEAALSGCFLLLSNRVGAIPDLANNKNSMIFNPYSDDDIRQTLEKAFSMGNDDLDIGYEESLCLASRFSPQTFSVGVTKLINNLAESNI